ncbi:MAG: hypothetical protein ACRDZ9_00025 [Acidimicrobiales bacterium]
MSDRRRATLPVALVALGLWTAALVGTSPASGQTIPSTTATQPPTTYDFGPPSTVAPPTTLPPPTTVAPPTTTATRPPPTTARPESTTTTSTVPPSTTTSFLPPTSVDSATPQEETLEPLEIRSENRVTPWLVFALLVLVFAATAFGALWWLATRRW